MVLMGMGWTWAILQSIPGAFEQKEYSAVPLVNPKNIPPYR